MGGLYFPTTWTMAPLFFLAQIYHRELPGFSWLSIKFLGCSLIFTDINVFSSILDNFYCFLTIFIDFAVFHGF